MKKFYALLISQWFANAADSLYIVALISLLYKASGSGFSAAIFPIIVTLGMTASGFVFAFLMKKQSKEFLLLFTQLLKTAILFFIIFNDEASLLIIGPAVFLISFLDGFARPIQSAYIPILHNDLNKANSIVQGSNQLIQLLMWPLGAIIVSTVSSLFLLKVSVILYVISTIVTARFVSWMKSDSNESDKALDVEESTITSSMSFAESVKYVLSDKVSRKNTLLVATESLASTAWISAIFLVYISTHLNVDEKWWGILNAFYMISMIASSAILIKLNTKKTVISFSALVSVIATVMFGFAPNVYFAILACLIQGAALQVRSIQINTVLQTYVHHKRLPYVYSLQQTVYTIAFCIGSLLFGLLSDLIEIEAVYAIAAVIALIATIQSFNLERYLNKLTKPVDKNLEEYIG